MRKVLFIFGELTDSDVEWLASAGERVHLTAGTTLISLGSRVEHLYIVLDGQLSIRSAAGAHLARLESGEIVGEMSLVDPAPTAVSVEVSADATVLRIPDTTLRDKLAADFPFAARFYRAICVFLADRMRATTRRMGYGESQAQDASKDELNENVLDTVHLAGARFDRMLKKLAG
ncbi:MAG: cyclic nucleotide-binding domain-containing protein [Bacillota bacterium]